MRLTRFGALVLPEPDGQSDLTFTARDSLIEMPNGAFDQDGSRVVMLPQVLTHRGWLLAPIEDHYSALVRVVAAGRNVLHGMDRDGNERVTYAKLLSVSHPAKSGGDYPRYQPVTLKFKQDYPFWWDATDGGFLDQGLTLDTGRVLDGNVNVQTPATLPFSYTITNNGDCPILMGALQISLPSGGFMVDLTLDNLNTGFMFEWNRSLAGAQVLNMDFLTKTITVDGGDAYSGFSLPPTQQDWMLLGMGANLITVQAGLFAAASLSIKWRWRRHYLY